MPTSPVAGATVDRNDEGFFTDPEQWTEAMAPELAAAEGIGEFYEIAAGGQIIFT
ncbi:MAG: TusE/DsrC/DsvC family sulfur relay protein [Acidimicrobiia bacterium]|nr:TusE/DsrC/DsvC family sulfur relay protein [Acidimicrobiia bacterium]